MSEHDISDLETDSDDELIDLVARIWVQNGGDGAGIDYCWRQIKERADYHAYGEEAGDE